MSTFSSSLLSGPGVTLSEMLSKDMLGCYPVFLPSNAGWTAVRDSLLTFSSVKLTSTSAGFAKALLKCGATLSEVGGPPNFPVSEMLSLGPSDGPYRISAHFPPPGKSCTTLFIYPPQVDVESSVPNKFESPLKFWRMATTRFKGVSFVRGAMVIVVSAEHVIVALHKSASFCGTAHDYPLYKMLMSKPASVQTAMYHSWEVRVLQRKFTPREVTSHPSASHTSSEIDESDPLLEKALLGVTPSGVRIKSIHSLLMAVRPSSPSTYVIPTGSLYKAIFLYGGSSIPFPGIDLDATVVSSAGITHGRKEAADLLSDLCESGYTSLCIGADKIRVTGLPIYCVDFSVTEECNSMPPVLDLAYGLTVEGALLSLILPSVVEFRGQRYHRSRFLCAMAAIEQGEYKIPFFHTLTPLVVRNSGLPDAFLSDDQCTVVLRKVDTLTKAVGDKGLHVSGRANFQAGTVNCSVRAGTPGSLSLDCLKNSSVPKQVVDIWAQYIRSAIKTNALRTKPSCLELCHTIRASKCWQYEELAASLAGTGPLVKMMSGLSEMPSLSSVMAGRSFHDAACLALYGSPEDNSKLAGRAQLFKTLFHGDTTGNLTPDYSDIITLNTGGGVAAHIIIRDFTSRKAMKGSLTSIAERVVVKCQKGAEINGVRFESARHVGLSWRPVPGIIGVCVATDYASPSDVINGGSLTTITMQGGQLSETKSLFDTSTAEFSTLLKIADTCVNRAELQAKASVPMFRKVTGPKGSRDSLGVPAASKRLEGQDDIKLFMTMHDIKDGNDQEVEYSPKPLNVPPPPPPKGTGNILGGKTRTGISVADMRVKRLGISPSISLPNAEPSWSTLYRVVSADKLLFFRSIGACGPPISEMFPRVKGKEVAMNRNPSFIFQLPGLPPKHSLHWAPADSLESAELAATQSLIKGDAMFVGQHAAPFPPGVICSVGVCTQLMEGTEYPIGTYAEEYERVLSVFYRCTIKDPHPTSSSKFTGCGRDKKSARSAAFLHLLWDRGVSLIQGNPGQDISKWYTFF